MIKKLVMVVGVVAVVTVLGLFAVDTASAQGPTPTPVTPWGHAWGGICEGYPVMSDALSKLLGMTPQQIYDARASGKTLSDIAKSKGISDQKVIDTMLASKKSVIDQAVKDGRLTQAQADWMLARVKANMPYMLTNLFGPGGFFGGHGPWGANPPTTTK